MFYKKTIDAFTYYIDEEKRTVVAKFSLSAPTSQGFQFTELNKICNRYRKYLDNSKLDRNTVMNAVCLPVLHKMPLSYKGKATCCEEDKDKFSVEFGMELAKRRALRSYYKSMIKFNEEIRQKVANFVTLLHISTTSLAGAVASLEDSEASLVDMLNE